MRDTKELYKGSKIMQRILYRRSCHTPSNICRKTCHSLERFRGPVSDSMCCRKIKLALALLESFVLIDIDHFYLRREWADTSETNWEHLPHQWSPPWLCRKWRKLYDKVEAIAMRMRGVYRVHDICRSSGFRGQRAWYLSEKMKLLQGSRPYFTISSIQPFNSTKVHQ